MITESLKKELFRLPVQEKRVLIEMLWDSIHDSETEIPIPSHHERILRERMATYETDKANAVTLEEFERRFRRN
jgi:putative addiction module component (TIGR02574 family)